MGIVDFIFNWLLPWIFSAFMVVIGLFAVWRSVGKNIEKNTRLTLLVGGVAVVLTCGDRLKVLHEGYKPIEPTVKEIRV